MRISAPIPVNTDTQVVRYKIQGLNHTRPSSPMYSRTHGVGDSGGAPMNAHPALDAGSRMAGASGAGSGGFPKLLRKTPLVPNHDEGIT